MDSDNDNDFCDNVDSGNVSSGDDGDDDFGMEVDLPSSAERQLDADDYQYKVLTTDEIVQHQREIIDDVNLVLKLHTPITRILLNQFKWDKEKLLEKYFDGNIEEFFKDAHVINPFNKAPEAIRQKTTRSQCEECEICFSLLPPDLMTGLECAHRFCLSCWREYLTTKIVAEGLGQTISCAAHGCDILVDDVTVTKLVQDARVRVKYQQLITNSFVECNQLLRWCPSVDCTYAVKVPYAESRRVLCKCGHVFCFACGENWHDPVRCRWLKKWIKKCDDDSETSNWIAANTKECPKCSVTIEKDGGCNHMVCKNQNCKYEFCWVCLSTWEPHGSSWYNCNRYDEDEAKSARDAQEKLRSSLARYLHYYNRYMNHMQSMKFENKLYASVKQKMEEMQQHNMSWIEVITNPYPYKDSELIPSVSQQVQFLKKAVDILCRCRQTLMYTYVFAYYLKKNNQSMIFEDNQKDLESATETLSEYLERDITSENLADIKQKVQDKYRYCEKRCSVLLKHVHEGYDTDWWDYTE
ncbi:hypothetical protein KR074_002827 [Drosophila pseudoananassae]|nr:hypothetical protein KR074_002827 [Drosophila pseudoananassae]